MNRIFDTMARHTASDYGATLTVYSPATRTTAKLKRDITAHRARRWDQAPHAQSNQEHTDDYCAECQASCCDMGDVRLRRNRLMHSSDSTATDHLHITRGFGQWLIASISLQYAKEGLTSFLEDEVPRKISEARVAGRQSRVGNKASNGRSSTQTRVPVLKPVQVTPIRVNDGLTHQTGSGKKQSRGVGLVKVQQHDSHQVVKIVLIGSVGSGKSSFINSIRKPSKDVGESSCDIQETTTVIDETQLQVLLDTLGDDQKRGNMQTLWNKISDRESNEFVFNFRQSPTNEKPFVHDREELSPATPPPSVTKIAVSENFKNSQLDTDALQRNAGHHAAISGDLKKLILLVETVGLPADAKSSNKLTMLHLAAIHQHLQVVEYLCKAHPALVPETDAIGRNACHIAAQKGNLAMVMMLVEHGTDVYATAGDGSTLLHITASHESSDMVRYLCENFFFNHLNNPNNIGLKPIHFAARCSLQNVKVLLNKGEVPHVQSQTGSTILHVAALRGKLDILRFVCEKYGYVLMVTDNVGFSAAHQASRHGHLECLKYLLGVNSLLASMVNCHGWTIAHSAAREGQLEVLTYLWENYPHVATQVDADNRNVAHHAAQSGHINCLGYLFQHNIVDPWAADKEGMTVPNIAERHGREETLHWLRSSPFAAMVNMNNSHSHMALGRSRQNGET